MTNLKGGAMSQLHRIFVIDNFIKRFGRVTKLRLIEELEVSPETIKKDIAFMRYALNAPIKYDFKLKSYIYAKPFDFLSFVSEESIIFYVFINALANDMKNRSINYIPIVPNNILKNLSQNISEEYFELIQQIEYHSSIVEEMDTAIFFSIIKAMRYKNKITLEYTNAIGKKTIRELEPYKLINYLRNWYVIAYCLKRESIATFLISRMKNIKIEDKEFDSTITINQINKFSENAFGIYKSKETTNVTIRFYEPAFYKVKNQIWHKNQQKNEGTINGKHYLDFIIPVGENSEEIFAKVMHMLLLQKYFHLLYLEKNGKT